MTEKEYDRIIDALEDASSFVYCVSEILKIGIEHHTEHRKTDEEVALAVDSFISMSRFYIENEVREQAGFLRSLTERKEDL